MVADIIIKNGQCCPMTGEESFHWLAIQKDKIIALGNHEGYRELISNETKILDAKGASVLPSFIDSHFHLVQTAMNEDSLDLSSVQSFNEIGEKIKEYEKENPGKKIFGVRLDKNNLKEKAYPDRQILDSFSNTIPIWINCYDYQVSMLNTYGMLYYKIPYRIEGMEQDRNGVPIGIFRGKANAALRTSILNNYSDVNRFRNVTALMSNLLKVGITTVNSMEGGYMYSDSDADFIFRHTKDFPLDLALFYQSSDLERIRDMRLKRVGGSFYIDGTIGARTAALTRAYSDMPEEMGTLIFSQKDLNEFVEECYRNHLQLSLYTIGDRAIDLALNAHEYAFSKTGISGLRHRLEHVILARPDQMHRAKELGLIFSMSPSYERYWGGEGKMYNQRLGEGYKLTNPFREIIDCGVKICGGSDSDVCIYNPFLGIHWAVNHPVEKNRTSLFEALEMYTKNAAYAIFEEDRKGTLEIGKLADVIILDRDIFDTLSSDLEQVKVMSTVKSGEILHNLL